MRARQLRKKPLPLPRNNSAGILQETPAAPLPADLLLFGGAICLSPFDGAMPSKLGQHRTVTFLTHRQPPSAEQRVTLPVTHFSMQRDDSRTVTVQQQPDHRPPPIFWNPTKSTKYFSIYAGIFPRTPHLCGLGKVPYLIKYIYE